MPTQDPQTINGIRLESRGGFGKPEYRQDPFAGRTVKPREKLVHRHAILKIREQRLDRHPFHGGTL